ncbi:unnamed protein product, partial [Bubo scandiacus]
MRADKCLVPEAVVTSADLEVTGAAAPSQLRDLDMDLAELCSTQGRRAIQKVIMLLSQLLCFACLRHHFSLMSEFAYRLTSPFLDWTFSLSH